MTHKKKRLSDEINLTPLLDVLFSILFIVMLAGTASENTMRQNYENRLAAAEGGVKRITKPKSRNSKVSTKGASRNSPARIHGLIRKTRG